MKKLLIERFDNIGVLNTRKITKGTKEWADSNVNCYYGCSNNCRYCYAKKIAIRFKRETPQTWKIMKPNYRAINKNYAKRKGTIMFPTSHDITLNSLNNCLIVLEKLLRANNRVLITSKPCFDCIKQICDIFSDYKDLILFRFTITSINDRFLQFWEPEAPHFEERLSALNYAYEKGFKTSISIEPFLDKDPTDLIDRILPFITNSIWIGKMNYIKASNINKAEEKEYKRIRMINSKKNIKQILMNLKKYDHPLIMIKDSIINYLLNNNKRLKLY